MDYNTSADNPGLDTLALGLDREIAALHELDYRLNSLRLALIDGNADFVTRAAVEADTAAATAGDLAGPRESALGEAAKALGLDPATTLVDIVDGAPAPHRELLSRLLGELSDRTQAIAVQRDAIGTLAENGRRTLAGLIDLDESGVGDSPIDLVSDARTGNLFVGDF